MASFAAFSILFSLQKTTLLELEFPTIPQASSLFSVYSEIISQSIRTDCKQVLFLSEELKAYPQSQTLVFLPWPRKIFSITEFSEQYGILLLFPDALNTSYALLLESAGPHLNRKHIIFTENIHRIYEAFDLFWKYRIIDVIGLLRLSTDEYVVYNYYPFQKHDCSSANPVRITSRAPGKIEFSPKVEFFFTKSRMYDLQGCELKVALKDIKDPARPIRDATMLKGLTGKILNLMKDRMNFKAVINNFEDDLDAYVAFYFNFTPPTVLNVIKEKADVAVGRFTQILDWHPNVVFPRQTSSDCFTWAIPVRTLTPLGPLWIYIHMFDVYTWATFAVTYTVLLAVDRLAGTRCKATALELFGLSIGIPSYCRRRHSFHRFILAYWCLCMYTVAAAYQAIMGSFATVPPELTPVKTVSDLLRTDLRLYGDPKVFHVLNASIDTSMDVKIVLERFKTLSPGDISSEVAKIHRSGDVAILDSKLKLINEEKELTQKLGIERIVYFLQECVVNSGTTPLIVKRGSILERPMASLLIKLFESGIIDRWEEEDIEIISTRNATSHHFSLSKFVDAIIILCIGLGLATLVFFIELVIHLNKNLHYKKNCEKGGKEQST